VEPFISDPDSLPTFSPFLSLSPFDKVGLIIIFLSVINLAKEPNRNIRLTICSDYGNLQNEKGIYHANS
jgi:hypothetical protein